MSRRKPPRIRQRRPLHAATSTSGAAPTIVAPSGGQRGRGLHVLGLVAGDQFGQPDVAQDRHAAAADDGLATERDGPGRPSTARRRSWPRRRTGTGPGRRRSADKRPCGRPAAGGPRTPAAPGRSPPPASSRAADRDGWPSSACSTRRDPGTRPPTVGHHVAKRWRRHLGEIVQAAKRDDRSRCLRLRRLNGRRIGRRAVTPEAVRQAERRPRRTTRRRRPAGRGRDRSPARRSTAARCCRDSRAT